MANVTGSAGWLRGTVKAVPSGDCMVIMAVTKGDAIPPEKSINLAGLSAPRLARRGGLDEPFAWESREYLRKLCVGKEVVFKVDYTVASIGRDFGSVFMGKQNVAELVVADGWAKVREQGGQRGEVAPNMEKLLALEEQARQQAHCQLFDPLKQVPGASEAAIRKLPPSAIGDSSNFDAMALLNAKRGSLMEAVVEQCPSMGRRPPAEAVVEPEITTNESNGETEAESLALPTSAQRLAASSPSSASEVAPDPFGREAKHFTETRVLNKDVRIVLEGVDKYNNLIGTLHYQVGDTAKDLALELAENGLAKYVEWSANMMEEDAKRRLKSVELQAKKDRIRMWTNYVPPATNSKAIHDQNFTGKVVEVVSGDCIVVADDSAPYGSPSAERRVNLSSIRCPKMGNPRRDEKPAPYAREAKEFLRQRLIDRQVNVSMEYSRKIPMGDGMPAAGSSDRVMDFGSVFLVTPSKLDGDNSVSAPPPLPGQQPGINVAELVLSRGFGTVIRHRDFEERSNFYDALLSAESRAITQKKGIHSAREPPVNNVKDLTTVSAKKAKDFLPFLQRARRHQAVVEYVLSGHRFKLLIPKETCSIAFSLSGVRCPGRNEPYSEDAIAFMRRKILQRDVEVEIETADRTGTFLGSLWESRTNMGAVLLEAGLAKFQQGYGADRIPDAHLLTQAEESAKRQKLKVWEKYVEGQEQELANGSSARDNKQKETVLKTVGDASVASIQQKLASLSLGEAPVVGAFNPKKGDLVLAQFSADNSWNRAMIVNVPRGGVVQSTTDQFEVFYIDYGNQEVTSYSRLRPLEPSLSSVPALAQLCSLAFIKVPNLEEDYGQEAAEYLSESTLNNSRELRAMVEDKDTSGGKVKGQGTGTVLLVDLVDAEAGLSVNAAMLKEGLARLERRRRWESKERQSAIDNLEKFQEEAKKHHVGIWQYGDCNSDDEEPGLPAKKASGRN
ncbi:hypothetical protein V2J09_005991 [Rumex salicifolius]